MVSEPSLDSEIKESTGPSTEKKEDFSHSALSQIQLEYKQPEMPEFEMTSFKADSFRLIILANPGSGIYSGSKFLAMLEPGEQRLVNKNCKVEIFDLTMAMYQAVSSLEKALENRGPTEHVLCALMGGDGSVSRNVNYLLEKSKIIRENVNMIGFVFLPFGTGNDCSRSLGWGARDTG